MNDERLGNMTNKKWKMNGEKPRKRTKGVG